MARKTKPPLAPRLQLVRASAEALRKANAQRADQPPTLSYEEMDWSSLGLATMLRRLEHSDELVVDRTLGELTRTPIWTRPAAERVAIDHALGALQTRLIEEAREQGYAWTPLMRKLGGTGWGRAGAKPRRVDTQKKRLRGWVRAQTDTTPMTELLEAMSYDRVLMELVAREARAVDLALARVILDQGYWRAVEYLAENPATSAQVMRDLLEHILTQLEETGQSRHAVRFMRQFLARGLAPKPSDIVRLETIAIHADSVSTLSQRNITAAYTLLALPNLSGEQIRALWEAVVHSVERTRGYSLEPFIEHPNTPIDILRTLAREDSRGTARVKLANNPSALSDPEIRETLASKTQGKQVLKKLIQSASAERVNELFDTLVRRNPMGAAEMVSEDDLPDDVELRREHMLRMLRSKNQDVRKAAVRLAGRMSR